MPKCPQCDSECLGQRFYPGTYGEDYAEAPGAYWQCFECGAVTDDDEMERFMEQQDQQQSGKREAA